MKLKILSMVCASTSHSLRGREEQVERSFSKMRDCGADEEADGPNA